MKTSLENKPGAKGSTLQTMKHHHHAESAAEQCVNAGHDCSEEIGNSKVGANGKEPGLVTEFFRNVTGLNQDIELNKTEEELLEELMVLTARRKVSTCPG